MNETQPVYYDDEIDLREIVLTLFKGWKMILLITVLVGASAFGYSKMQTPVYEASATVSIDQTALSLSISPDNILLGDDVRQAVADVLERSAISLPVPTIVAKGTLFTISIQSPNAQEAVEIANAWAETGVAYIAEQIPSTLLLGNAQEIFTEADQALLNYLQL